MHLDVNGMMLASQQSGLHTKYSPACQHDFRTVGVAERCLPTSVMNSQISPLRRASMHRIHSSQAKMRTCATKISQAEVGKVQEDQTVWIRSTSTLFLGTLGTNLLLASQSHQVLSLETWKLGLLLLVTDLIFVATSYKFLDLADAFDRDWHKTRTPYPGPAWGSEKGDARDKNQAREPYLFKNYVQLFLSVGFLIPLSGVIAAFFRSDEGPLAAAIILPYLLTMVIQIVQELTFLKQESALWPIVPMHHMGYRFLQMARAGWIITALEGPSWLMGLVVLLTSLWFINFGAVMTWQTSLYYWHRQEEFGKGF